MADPIVLQLQADCLDASVPISTLLRKAKLIASKLALEDTCEWLDSELNGYSCALADLPAYRKGAGQPKFFNPVHGWLDIVLTDSEAREMVSTAFLPQAIAEIEHIVSQDGGFAVFGFTAPINDFLHNQLGIRYNCGLYVSKAVLVGALEGVKNAVLQWAMQLEAQGVLGEGLRFSSAEREKAHTVTNIYGGNIGVFGNVAGNVKNAHFISSNGVDVDSLRDFVSQAMPALAGLDPKTRAEVQPLLEDLRREAAGAPEVSKVQNIVKSLRTILEGAGGNIVASALLNALGGGG